VETERHEMMILACRPGCWVELWVGLYCCMLTEVWLVAVSCAGEFPRYVLQRHWSTGRINHLGVYGQVEVITQVSLLAGRINHSGVYTQVSMSR